MGENILELNSKSGSLYFFNEINDFLKKIEFRTVRDAKFEEIMRKIQNYKGQNFLANTQQTQVCDDDTLEI